MSVIIAIDGPAGSGKSTVSRHTAITLNLGYVDTGASYRSIAWLLITRGIAYDDEERILQAAGQMRVTLMPLTSEGRQRVFIDGIEVTAAIRTPAVAQATSKISTIPSVRRLAVNIQRRLAEENSEGSVVEGRDIGTVVYPDAELKIYITASPRIRAERRTKELRELGQRVSLETVLREQNERDERDTGRADSPLIAANDAVMLNTDNITCVEAVSVIVGLFKEKMSKI